MSEYKTIKISDIECQECGKKMKSGEPAVSVRDHTGEPIGLMHFKCAQELYAKGEKYLQNFGNSITVQNNIRFESDDNDR